MKGTLFAHIGGKNGTMGEELTAFLPRQKPNIYIEPFGGSFGLGIQSDYYPDNVNMIHNELDNVIHAIFKAVTYDPGKTLDAVYILLDKYEYSQETVDYFRFLIDYEEITGENLFNDDFALGAAAWILKTITRNGDCKGLKKSEHADPISCVIKKFENREETAYRLQGVSVLKMNAITLLEYLIDIYKGQGQDVFIYIDAPYCHSGKRTTKQELYRVDVDKNDQIIVKLAGILEKINQYTNCKIMASEYDNPIYNAILTAERGWEKVKVCDRYKYVCVPDCYGSRPMETEYIWRNYNEYGKLSPHIVETTTDNVGEKPMEPKELVAATAKPKYKVEVSFLGTVDDQQVEDEIITILKGNFLAKMTACNPESTALESSPDMEKS